MKISQINLNGLDLINDDYFFTLTGLFDIEKTIITNDLMVDGENYGRSKNNPKSLVLNGFILNRTDEALYAFNKALASNGLKPLIINNMYVCYVELKNRISDTNDRYIISCQLTMPDPYLYTLNPQTVELGALYSTGVIFAPGQGVIFGANKGVTFGAAIGAGGTVTNEGNVDSYPVITIIGTCSGITVTNKTTNKSISVNAILTDSDTLVIDCRPETCGVYLNGNQEIQLKTNDGWIRCQPGDNLFTFSRSSLQNKKHCKVELQSRWI